MTAIYFLAYLGLLVALLAAVLVVFLPRRSSLATLFGLALWLAYVGILSKLGVIADPSRRPPGILLLAIPLVLFVLFLARSEAAGNIAAALPLWLLTAFQSFRIGVELLLHQLYLDGLVPRLMTYEQGNWDILVGLSAPFAAWLAAKGSAHRRTVLIWNVAGLLLLANIVLRAILTSPGPLHLLPSELANQAVGLFPFTYIAGFFAPLAVVLHVLSVRALKRLPAS